MRHALAVLTALVTTSCSLLVSTDHLADGAGASGADGGDARAEIPADAAADGGEGPDAAEAGTLDGGGVCPEAPDPSLIVHYAFDEGAGTKLTDCSKNHLDATIHGSPGWTITPRVGAHALGFDGSSTCVELPSSTLLALAGKPFTIAAWVSVQAFPTSTSGRFIFAKTSDSSTKGYRLATDTDGVVNFTVGQSSGTSTGVGSKGKLPTGTWLHVALTLDPTTSTAAIYVNGALSDDRVTMPPIIEDAAAIAHIGCRNHDLVPPQNALTSSLDDFRLYDRGLEPEAIAALAK
ncbi:MAG: LamG domain-containing protein [Labilithrix sp.]